MTDTDWWQSLKEGDILLWTQGRWRYKGVVDEVRHLHRDVIIVLQNAHTRAETHEGRWVGPEQEHRTFMDETVRFGQDALLDPDWDWMHKKTADIRISVQDTTEGREFRVFGEGDGIPDKTGAGGGLRYLGGESPLSS